MCAKLSYFVSHVLPEDKFIIVVMRRLGTLLSYLDFNIKKPSLIILKTYTSKNYFFWGIYFLKIKINLLLLLIFIF